MSITDLGNCIQYTWSSMDRSSRGIDCIITFEEMLIKSFKYVERIKKVWNWQWENDESYYKLFRSSAKVKSSPLYE